MTDMVSLQFADWEKPKKGTLLLLVNENGQVSDDVESLLGKTFIAPFLKAFSDENEKQKSASFLLPENDNYQHLVLLKVEKSNLYDRDDWFKLGGRIYSLVSDRKHVGVLVALSDIKVTPEDAAEIAGGIQLRAYKFDKYQTDKSKKSDKKLKISLNVQDSKAAQNAFKRINGVCEGVMLARDLVNEPANILGTEEFAATAQQLEKLGVKVEVLAEKDLKKLGMGALLGVAKGSARPPYVVVMHWRGGKEKSKPLAFVGKGVVFDSGGISIKTAGGMEEMKGDMGGAAAVVGLMHSLARTKAKVNAVGVIGLVENMPDAAAQRPGDIVTSMSGQTIEVINTDAEGRLVLADALYYTQQRFEPQFMIDLATLTGAIIVALGENRAGLFSNDDELAGRLYDVGRISGEQLWRLPLDEEYDEMVNSKFADMRNSAGRAAGSITAAQFLQRFVGKTPWAHLDIAGAALGANKSDYNRSWASGFGVRLLERLIRDYYEEK